MTGFLTGFGISVLYLLLFFCSILLMRRSFSERSEGFRKLLHFGILLMIFILLYVFEVWWHAVVTCALIAALIFPLLHFAERFQPYAVLLVQRRPNEIKWNTLQMFAAFGIVIAVSQGVFGSCALAVASLFVWGFGDAAAALIGKRFGRHKLRGRMIEGTKSVEGSAAMAVTAFLICAAVLLCENRDPWPVSVLAAAATAVVSSVVELYTKSGADTITVPLAALAVLSGILWAFGSLRPVWL